MTSFFNKSAKPLFIGLLTTTFLSACSTMPEKMAEEAKPELLAEPIIYSVTDEDSEIILYPTFHILPEGVEWKTPTLEASLARAEEIWYEIPVGADTDPAMQGLVMKYGIDQETKLSEKIPADMAEKLSNITGDIGVPMQALEVMQPWMASLTVSVTQMTLAGFDPNLGVEKKLQEMTGDKPTRALETAEQQIRFFADMSDEEQIGMLGSALDDFNEGTDVMLAAADNWASGNFDALETEMIIDFKNEYPAFYDVIFTQRNSNWAEILDEEMQGSGVDFVAVGAGHLIGEDSVQSMLEAKGYTVKILTVKK